MSEAESEIGFFQVGLGGVLHQHSPLVVPMLQREFAWTTKEMKQLLRDFAREIDGSHSRYFLGTIVTIPRKGGILEVVDGQQRLAATSIILSCIKRYLKTLEPDVAASIDADFLTTFSRSARSKVARLRLNTDDNEFFRSLIADEDPEPIPTRPSHRLLLDAIRETRSYINEITKGLAVRDHGNALNRWVEFIEKKAIVILLRVPNATNAFRMFETLNDRGKRVSQSDLVKSFLLGQAGERIAEVQQRWSYMRGALESMESGDETIEFLRHAMSVMRGFIREADVFEKVQLLASGEQRAIIFAGQLEALANVFVATYSSDHDRWNSFNDPMRKALDVLNLFDVGVLRPLMLAVAFKFKGREAERSFRFLVDLGVRLMVTNRTRTGSVEEGLANVGHNVYNETILDTKALKEHIKPLMPTNGQFKAAFETATVSNRKLARYYMRSLEMMTKDEPEPWHIPNDDRNVINLEHVLPDKPEGNWPQFSDDEVKLFRNRIGNLVLLRASENSTLKSGTFEDKRKIYEDCPYETTKQVADCDEWTVETIIARQGVLADLALRAWPA